MPHEPIFELQMPSQRSIYVSRNDNPSKQGAGSLYRRDAGIDEPLNLVYLYEHQVREIEKAFEADPLERRPSIERRFYIEELDPEFNLENYPKLNTWQGYLLATDDEEVWIRTEEDKLTLGIRIGRGIYRLQVEIGITDLQFRYLREYVTQSFSKVSYVLKGKDGVDTRINRYLHPNYALGAEASFLSSQEARRYRLEVPCICRDITAAPGWGEMDFAKNGRFPEI